MAKNSVKMIEISNNLTLVEAAVAISRELLPRPTHLTPGWCAALASILEATARKPGNVSPDKSFSDLSYDDLCNAALAMVPALDREKKTSLGGMIKDAVICSRSKTLSNANLGIILAISPLAAASTSPGHPLRATDADTEIERCNAQDSLDIYDAINLSTAGSLGKRDSYDIHSPAPKSIHHAMRHAAVTEPTDSIAALWASGYQQLWDSLVSDLHYFEAQACRGSSQLFSPHYRNWLVHQTHLSSVDTGDKKLFRFHQKLPWYLNCLLIIAHLPSRHLTGVFVTPAV